MDKANIHNPTLKEITTALLTMIIAYQHLLLAKGELRKIVKNKKIPELLKGLLIMEYIFPIAVIITADPILSQNKGKVFELLKQMTRKVAIQKQPRNNRGRFIKVSETSTTTRDTDSPRN